MERLGTVIMFLQELGRKKLKRRILSLMVAGVFLMLANNSVAQDLENQIYLELKDGRVVIDLLSDVAPEHVARIKELTRDGYYNGVVFHRVIEGFMAQTGDPTGTGMGGTGKKLKAEFSDMPFMRGTVGMARGRDPNSGDSQFFICFSDSPFLNGNYTVWGTVSQGMEHVDKIARGEPPTTPDIIVMMQVAADAE